MLYSVRASAALPNNATKVAAQLATGANITNRIVGVDISFDGVDGSKKPVLVSLAKETGVSSTGGSAPTPVQLRGKPRSAQSTARINDTTDGSAPTVLEAWYVPPTSGMSIQFPLGREIEMGASEFLALRVTTTEDLSGLTYDATLIFEE